jgi:hypothetical protein
VAGRERPLDPGLAGEEPVHRPVQLVLVGALDPETGTQGALAEEGRGGKLGRGGDQAARHERRREVPHPRRAPVEDARQPERAEHPEDRGDMAVGQAAADGERLARGQEALAREPGPDELDEWLGQVGQVGQGLLLDLAVLAVRVAEQRARVLAAALAAHHPDYVHSRSLRLPHREEPLVPDHLGDGLEADPLEALRHLGGMDTGVPDVAHGEGGREGERLGPVHPGVA